MAKLKKSNATKEPKAPKEKKVKEPKDPNTPRAKPISKSRRAGLTFPVGRTDRILRQITQGRNRYRQTAAVYLAAVLEYLATELIEISAQSRHDEGASKKPKDKPDDAKTPHHSLMIIQPRNIKNGLKKDDEMCDAFPEFIINIATDEAIIDDEFTKEDLKEFYYEDKAHKEMMKKKKKKSPKTEEDLTSESESESKLEKKPKEKKKETPKQKKAEKVDEGEEEVKKPEEPVGEEEGTEEEMPKKKVTIKETKEKKPRAAKTPKMPKPIKPKVPSKKTTKTVRAPKSKGPRKTTLKSKKR